MLAVITRLVMIPSGSKVSVIDRIVKSSAHETDALGGGDSGGRINGIRTLEEGEKQAPPTFSGWNNSPLSP